MSRLESGESEKAAETAVEEYKDKITWIRKMSADAAEDIEDDSLDFVYIDANHRFDYVLQDIRTWFPKVKPGRVISGHDYNYHEVAAAVEAYCKVHNLKLGTYAKEWWFFK